MLPSTVHSKDQVRELVLKSSDHCCAFCQKKPFASPQAAHIWSKSRGGPCTFWNLLPLCPDHNPSEREQPPGTALLPYHQALRAFYFWSFARCRHDIALKIALYVLYERIVLDDPRDDSLAYADRFLSHVIWICRFFSFQSSLDYCTHLRSVIHSPTAPTRQDRLIEQVAGCIDQGRWRQALKLTERFDQATIQKGSRSLSWRLAQNPAADFQVIQRFRAQQGFPGGGDLTERSFFAPEREFDSRFRELTSDLTRAAHLGQQSAVDHAFDRLAAACEQIRSGLGCATPYQHLHVVLNCLPDRWKRRKEWGELRYWTRHHGSQTAIRSFWAPSWVVKAGYLADLGHVQSAGGRVDLATSFTPVPGSSAEAMSKSAHLPNELHLLSALRHIGRHLVKKTC